MARRADTLFPQTGTRVVLFPQQRNNPGFATPEVVYVNAHPGTIKPGPEDDRIKVINAKNKKPYFNDEEEQTGGPPYQGKRHSRFDPARPTAGHFDRFEPDTPQFSAVAAFAAARRALEVWEHYLGRRVRWYFTDQFPVVELMPKVNSSDSWSGLGFLEYGYPEYDLEIKDNPDCENFDVVAHEIGHFIMKDVIGQMPNDEKSMQYRAHEEAAADLVSTIAALHFDSVVDRVLEDTGGMLFSANALARVGQWGPGKKRESRRLFHDWTMSAVRASKDLNKHLLSEPFSGAAYDLLVVLYQGYLVDRGAIAADLARRSRHVPGKPVPDLRPHFARARARQPDDFKDALLDARDALAALLARTWTTTPKDGLTFAKVLANMLAADGDLHRGRHREAIRDAFAAREIAPDPAV